MKTIQTENRKQKKCFIYDCDVDKILKRNKKGHINSPKFINYYNYESISEDFYFKRHKVKDIYVKKSKQVILGNRTSYDEVIALRNIGDKRFMIYGIMEQKKNRVNDFGC